MEVILKHLPALQVLLPLIAAPICSLLPFRRLAWSFALLITLFTFIFSIVLFWEVYVCGEISYYMGNWPAPFGIEYKIDKLSCFFLLLISSIALFTISYALPSVSKEINHAKHGVFYSLYLLCFAGFLGIISTNDIFNIYVFLEISSLSTYALVAMGNDRKALISAFEYLILGSIGATFILIAIGFIYASTGSLNISDIALRMKPINTDLTIKVAVAFFTVGLALKIAIFPLHLWLANAYTNSPSFVASFLSGTGTKVGLYLFIRLSFWLFGKDLIFIVLPIDDIFIILGLLAIFIASIVAVMQDNIKRMLAYSSVAQIGYIILAIGLVNNYGLISALFNIISHSFIKSSMFMAAGAVCYVTGGNRLEHFKGIGNKMPFTMFVFIIGGFGLIGVPGTGGFIAKWYLLQSILQNNFWPIFIVILISSILSIIYVLRIIEAAFFSPCHSAAVKEAPILMIIPMIIMSLLSITFGIYPEIFINYINQIIIGLF